MLTNVLLLPITVPTAAALLILMLPKKFRAAIDAISLFGSFLILLLSILLFKRNLSYSMPALGFGIEFSLRLYHFSGFIVLAAAFFVFLITLYSNAFLREKSYSKQFYVYLLLSLAFINGAVLSDNLVSMLFFWEGMLITLFGMIYIGGKRSFKTATKAFIIAGVGDLCLMLGVAICFYISGTLAISKLHIPISGIGGAAFILLMMGAIAKAGSMPFHTWIPDAAIDAPLPFMAIVPASFEKLLGIYFLSRISLDIFEMSPDSWASMTLMIIGSITIVFVVSMALIQKNYKRLLSYHAISQVGYMILGIGTLVPAGIVGGLFHMINNVMYKSCLFLTGGAVEKQAGTTDLEKLGGLKKYMPVTFICYVITAASISGVPPFNGFFSKELVCEGALERGFIFYLAAIIGAFLTAASFLKLGHAAFLDKSKNGKLPIKEAPIQMLIPMIAIAALCVLFGVWNSLPLKLFIQPILGQERLGGRDFSGMPHNSLLVVITIMVLLGALLNHRYGVKKHGSGLKAAEHIHHAPVLSYIFNKAENGYFDPYNIGLNISYGFSKVAFLFDRAIDWVYNVFIIKVSKVFTAAARSLNDGSYKSYIIWSLLATGAVVIFLIKSMIGA